MHIFWETSFGLGIKFFSLAGAGFIVWLYYRNTVPEISRKKRKLLIILRLTAVWALLFLLFSSVFHLILTEQKKRVIAVVADNSSSMKNADSLYRIQLNNLIKILDEDVFTENYLYFAGDSLRKLPDFRLPDFTDNATDLGQVANLTKLNEFDHIILFSDGLWNAGINPATLSPADLGIPISIYLIGDSTDYNNYRLAEARFNAPVYADSSNILSLSIYRNFDIPDTVTVYIYLDGNLTRSKKIYWKTKEIAKKVNMKVIPHRTGKLTVKTEIRSSGIIEADIRDNYLAEEWSVYKGKYKLLIMGGTPNADVKILAHFLQKSKIIEPVIKYDIIKSSVVVENEFDAILLWNFPNRFSSSSDMNYVRKIIGNKKIGLWINITEETNINELSSLIRSVKFNDSGSGGALEVFPLNSYPNYYTGLFPDLNTNSRFWNELPPVESIKGCFVPEKRDNIILAGRWQDKTFPIISLSEHSSSLIIKSSLNNIFRWHMNLNEKPELQTGVRKFFLRLFNSLVQNATPEPLKIILTGNTIFKNRDTEIKIITDNKLIPVDSGAVIRLETFKDSKLINVEERSFVSGKDEYIFRTGFPNTGNYRLTAHLSGNGTQLFKTSKIVTVRDGSAEQMVKGRNKEVLKKLALMSGGSFIETDYSKNIFTEILQNIPYRKVTKDIRFAFRESKILLLLIVICFGLEWYLRKKWGLL